MMEALKDEVKNYIELQLRYYKFEAVEKMGELRAKFLVKVILTFFALVFTMFLGLTLSLYLGEVFDSFYKGFGVVALIFATFLVVAFLFRKSMFSFFFRDYLDENIPL